MKLVLALVLLVASTAACSFRGGDFAPMAKDPETPCSREAEAFCKGNLGSADLATCVKRETYRCELLEQQQGDKPAEPAP
jgi:hypothetical protein